MDMGDHDFFLCILHLLMAVFERGEDLLIAHLGVRSDSRPPASEKSDITICCRIAVHVLDAVHLSEKIDCGDAVMVARDDHPLPLPLDKRADDVFRGGIIMCDVSR